MAAFTRRWVAWALPATLTLCLAAGARAQPAAIDGDVERLFDWAEATFPTHFPGPATSRLEGPYWYRHYPMSGNYLGAAGADLYVLGTLTGGALQSVGVVGDFRCAVRPADCTKPHPSRAFISSRSMLLDSASRVVLIAPTLPVAGSEAIVGSAAVRLPISGRKVVAKDCCGYVLAADGSVMTWGTAGFDAAKGGLLVARMVWPEPLVDLASWGGLTADGTVIIPTEFDLVGGDYRVKSSLRVPLSQPARQLGPGGHVILRDGSVVQVTASLPFGPTYVQAIAGTSDVRSIACGAPRCLALRTDGRVLAWGWGPLGDGTEGQQSSGKTAREVRNLSSVRDVAVLTLGKTTGTSVALRDDGRVWIWGQRHDTGVDVVLPERMVEIDAVSDLACASHCVVRRTDGSVWGWGLNQQNELGNSGPVVVFQGQPVRAVGLTLP